MARKRRRKVELDDDLDEAPPPRRRRRRPSWRRRMVLLVVLAAGLVVAGPTIIAKTPLRNVLLSSALPPGAGRLAAGDAAFSWTGGQALAGLTLVDSQGQPLAAVERLTVDRSLVALAANRRHLGKIVIVRPVFHLETHAGGSNFEELVARLAEAANTAAPPSPAARDRSPALAEIEIIGATILGRDATTGSRWRIDRLDATARPAADDGWEASGTGFLAIADGSSIALNPASVAATAPSAGDGRFKFHLRPGEAGRQELDLLADRLPLAPLEPWLARVLPEARVIGTTSADLKVAWTSPAATAASPPSDPQRQASRLEPAAISAVGKVDLTDVRFTAAALAGDLLEVRRGSVAVDATLADRRLAARRLAAESEWLNAEATGEFDLARLASFSAGDLPTADASLTVRVDLPQLTRMLPRTLRLRPGVRIDSGSAEITARSSRDAGVRHWTLAAAAQDLLGSDGLRPIRWTQPVEVGVDLAESPAGPQPKRVIFRAPFASVTADGAAGGVEGQMEFNLDELAAQLGQFVDLSDWQLRGAGAGKFSWRDTGADRYAASATLDLTNIDVRNSGRIVWVDPQLHVELQSSGRRVGARPVLAETATALMRGARDALELELLEPAALDGPSRPWLVRIEGDGPLDSWAGRVRPWLAAVPDELFGQTAVNGRLRLSGDVVEINELTLSVRDFRTRIAGNEIIEPRIEASGDFRYSAAEAAINAQQAVFTSSTVAAKARGLSLQFAGDGPPTVHGDVAFRGDMERIAAWLGLAGVDGGLWPRGEAVGRVQLASDARRATANVTLTAAPFALMRGTALDSVGLPASASRLPSASVAWQEPNLQLGAEIVYVSADDRLQLGNLRLDGQTVRLTGGGSVDKLRTEGVVRGDWNVAYDANELAKLLATYLGPGVRFQGANSARLIASGRLRPEANRSVPGAGAEAAPHWSRRWTITAEAGWNAADFYGLPIGPAQLVANVREGQIQFNPLDLAVGDGRLTAQPRVLLDPPPQQLQFAAGPLASHVAVSEQVSDAMLKYAAPILANATRISGNFSIITEGVVVPLGEPRQTAAKGRVTMHTLSILPGPGLAEVVALVQRLEQLSRAVRRPEDLLGSLAAQPAPPVRGITMNERTIDVQVVDGRVYHRNLEFLIDDVPVRSYGSVGFDQTLALVIQVPVQEKWVRGTPALRPMIGQIIEIPVSGTFSRWQVDERAVGAFLAQAAQAAVGGAIGGEINRALEGLFRRQ